MAWRKGARRGVRGSEPFTSPSAAAALPIAAASVDAGSYRRQMATAAPSKRHVSGRTATSANDGASQGAAANAAGNVAANAAAGAAARDTAEAGSPQRSGLKEFSGRVVSTILDQVFNDLRPNAVTTPKVCCC